ncbi:DUF2768 family protein [Paenibacillaceae bacterium WGS1546]|uniref:DUF2768 family protein n=1 Tax=Cohnella sp. WGS1546 TaxID=3366810 RepID=UPI00372CFC85
MAWLAQTLMAAQLDAMSKMWLSLIGIGLMVIAALVITFARMKTKGWIRIALSLVAVIMLIYGVLCGLISIL